MIKKVLLLMVMASLSFAVYSQVIPKWRINDVVDFFNKKNDTVYIVNFWATFCKPCIAEIPDFIKIVKKYEGEKVKLLLVSVDLPSYYPVKIAAFAKKNNYHTKIVWLNETDADIFCPMIDKKWSGAIPATIIVNNNTGFKKFVEDEMKASEFEAIVKLAISASKTESQLKDHSFDPVNSNKKLKKNK